MFASLLKLGAVVSLASTAVAQAAIPNDIGNGVHVPGAIPAELNEPLQHRLAFHGSTGMTVSWSSFIQLSQPTVHYGTDPAKLDQVATSQVSTTYPTSRTYNNHVVLSGLKPATKYYYTVSFTNQGYAAYRPTYSFTTARAAGDMTSFSFAVYGDLGLMGHDGLSTVTGPGNSDTWAVLGPSETNTIQSLLSQKDTYDFMHHVGDIGYADYFLKESVQGLFGIGTNETQPSRQEVATQYESLSEQFFDQMQPITAEKPWFVSPSPVSP
ncbi:SPOSA6832_02560 [Sporobolomyces salmonicolor]|uniref:SPOSA6832_02560-mRNA-1:cds n=1 Tax=Sporidiobolus salmonicolor TaxID=5005 RepID=A0A0D6EMD4_SPOSA|nr:SPOSA6832_02560 [Sporobolomyces salmonicolor]